MHQSDPREKMEKQNTNNGQRTTISSSSHVLLNFAIWKERRDPQIVTQSDSIRPFHKVVGLTNALICHLA